MSHSIVFNAWNCTLINYFGILSIGTNYFQWKCRVEIYSLRQSNITASLSLSGEFILNVCVCFFKTANESKSCKGGYVTPLLFLDGFKWHSSEIIIKIYYIIQSINMVQSRWKKCSYMWTKPYSLSSLPCCQIVLSNFLSWHFLTVTFNHLTSTAHQ